MLHKSFHQTFHLGCLLGIAFFLPVSVWMVSAISIALIVNLAVSGNYSQWIDSLKKNSVLWFLPALFMLYLIWLLNTSDFSRAMNELRLKLPLVIFPLFVPAFFKITASRFRTIMYAFISGCFIAVTMGFAALAGIIPVELSDSRDLALFIPSIRLSILINLAVFSSFYFALRKDSGGPLFRYLLLTASFVMAFFLYRLLSVTGILIFTAVAIVTAVYYSYRQKRRLVGITLFSFAILVASIVFFGASKAWKRIHNPENPQVNIALDTTMSGRQYAHFPDETLVENGYLVWNNVCEAELRDSWNRRSNISYDSLDLAGNELRVTLIRYISFLGMTKDSVAVSRLSDNDITNISRGFANPLYAEVGSPEAKWYEIAWQAERYMSGANPSGHSVTQRLEFYRAAISIIEQNPLLGVGTGDVRRAFDTEYSVNNTPLSKKFQLMAHSQYLTFAVTFGIPGALLALAFIIFPLMLSRRHADFLFVVFILVIFISMFNDDTFESFTGATFFSYFYTLFLLNEYGSKDDN